MQNVEHCTAQPGPFKIAMQQWGQKIKVSEQMNAIMKQDWSWFGTKRAEKDMWCQLGKFTCGLHIR